MKLIDCQLSNVLCLPFLQVQSGVDAFILNMFLLGCISDSRGNVWHVKKTDYYMVECMPKTFKVSLVIQHISNQQLLNTWLIVPCNEFSCSQSGKTMLVRNPALVDRLIIKSNILHHFIDSA